MAHSIFPDGFTFNVVDACMSADPTRLAELVVGVSRLPPGRWSGDCPLTAAAKAGCLDCARIVAHISPSKATDQRGLDALSCAAAANDLPMLRFLLGFCDLASRDRKGRSALDWAALSNSAPCLKELLALEPDPWAPAPCAPLPSAPGWRALSLAVAAGSIEACAALLSAIPNDADPGAPGWMSQSALGPKAQHLARDAEPRLGPIGAALEAAEAVLERLTLRSLCDAAVGAPRAPRL
jgi:hypothetical protein